MPSTPASRTSTLLAAADALAAARPFAAFVGFDGFIDLILRPVASRRSMAPADFTPIRTMTEFAERVGAAAGKSTNIETVLTEARFGGNGPLFAGALANLGLSTTYAGAVGTTAAPHSPLDPTFTPFAARCARVVTLGPPSTTSCYEFDDGKLMLNDRSNVQAVMWAGVKSAFGGDELVATLGACRLIGLVNWSLLGGMQGILEGLMREVLPKLPAPTGGPTRRVFVDLADPTPRSHDDIRACLGVLTAMNQVPGIAVTLGLNLMESEVVAAVVGADAPYRASPARPPEVVTAVAKALREKLALDCVVIHPREGAAAASSGWQGWLDGPLCEQPKLSTGAGDHFNAGFALAQTLGLPLDQCLAVGTGNSGLYVRQAESPTPTQLASFLRGLAERGP